MRGSRRSNPERLLASALIGGAAAAMLFAGPVLAADPAVGPPTPLFTPSPAAPAQPVHSAAVASPGRHPTAAVQRIPLDPRPLIPPAATPAKLAPPPEPRPALSLETDLEPLAPAAGTASSQPDAGGTPPPAKPPSS